MQHNVIKFNTEQKNGQVQYNTIQYKWLGLRPPRCRGKAKGATPTDMPYC